MPKVWKKFVSKRSRRIVGANARLVRNDLRRRRLGLLLLFFRRHGRRWWRERKGEGDLNAAERPGVGRKWRPREYEIRERFDYLQKLSSRSRSPNDCSILQLNVQSAAGGESQHPRRADHLTHTLRRTINLAVTLRFWTP